MQILRNIFIALSGADDGILRQCGENEKSERTKYKNYGLTVAVPATLGGISFGYAVSTIASETWIFVCAGILWAGIIFIIDRFLISTLYKSELHNRWSSDFAFALRIVFSFVIGLIISHPLVLFVFREPIEESIKKQHRAEYSSEFSSYTKSTDEIYKKYNPDIESLMNKVECKTLLIQAETYIGEVQDIKYGTILCGKSSGRKGCAEKSICKTYNDERRVLNNELGAKIRARDAEIEHINIPSNQASNEASIIHFDYLTRTKNLEILMKENSHVWWTVYMLIIAFVLLDTLLVILKATIPMGAYEYRKDTILKEYKLIQYSDVKVKEVYANTLYSDIQSKVLAEEAKLKGAGRMINTVNKYYSYLEQQEEIFYQSTKKNMMSLLLNRILKKKDYDFEEKKVRRIRDLFDKAREKSIDELFKSIDK